ncbi:MAG TPA: aminotransferase class III-fold pyridoxal phosphate-dependent enzyme, partial [Nitrososphaera sp.]
STSSGEEHDPPRPTPSSLGIPKAIEKLVLVNEWNDFDAIEKTVKKEGRDIAAIITEPVMGNAGVIPPKQGYLKFLKELCDKNNIVLIFDEVKTGFRLSPGGAQKLFGVIPHMSTFAKSLSNGYPISVIAGAREIMEKVGKKKVFHGGTYASNPVSLAAVDATVDEIKKGYVHKNIEKFGGALMKGLADILKDRKVDGIVQGYPGMFQVLFTKQDQVSNFRELVKCNSRLYSKLHLVLLERGIMIDENIAEPFFTCAAHDDQDLQKTLEAINESLPVALASKVREARHRLY